MPSVLGNTPLGASIALESDLEQSLVAVTGAPFDAELEYISIQGETVVPFGTAHSTDMSIFSRVRLTGTPSKDTTGGIGYWSGAGTSSVQAKFDRTKATFFPSSSATCSYADAINSWADFGVDGNKGFCGTATTTSLGSGYSRIQNSSLNIYWHEDSFSFDIAYVDVWVSATKAHSLIPVRVGQVGYFYDKITGTLFGATTGTLTIGPDVSTPTFTPKTEIDLLAPLDSPAFTGTPTAPTAASGTNTTQVATTAFVQSAVGGLDLSIVSGKLCVSFEE